MRRKEKCDVMEERQTYQKEWTGKETEGKTKGEGMRKSAEEEMEVVGGIRMKMEGDGRSSPEAVASSVPFLLT